MKAFRWIHRILAVLNGVVMFLLLISAFSDIVSPADHLLFAYLGLAFPLFLFLNVGFLLLWAIMHKWNHTFVVLCSFLICWKPIRQYIPFHLRAKQPPREELIKVLTYNVMCFGYKDHTPGQPNPIIQYIADSGADIVCMQEYLEGHTDLLTENKIARALSMYPYHSYVPLVHYPRYTTGLAIYSKYPIRSSRKIRYDSSFNGSAVHELNVKGKKVIVVNNHLESFKFTTEDRSKYSEFIRNANTGTFDHIRGALERKMGEAFRTRAEQADIIADEIETLQGDYLIVCGDFNDTPLSYARRRIQGSLRDAYVESGRGAGVSYNENMFWFRIDHILHSPNMTACRATVDRVKLSDHYPVWCYLRPD